MTDRPEGRQDRLQDGDHEGRAEAEMDIDRMVNEGLGGGVVSPVENGKIGESTTDTMDDLEGG
jgi:hypothetical protein